MGNGLFTAGLVAILAGVYLDMVKIALLLGAVMILIGYSAGGSSSKNKSSSKSNDTTILHPVVYEDAGDPPYLYPKKGSVTVYPNGKKKRTTAQSMVDGAGIAAKATVKGLKKLMK